MAKKNIQDIYPLSPMQQGMLFHTLYAPDSDVYVEQLSCLLSGRLDVGAFARAWQGVVNRHSALRTAFLWEGLDEPLQVVYHRVELPVTQEDWSGLSDQDQVARLESFVREERKRGFDPAKPPLMRLALIRRDDSAHYFVWSHHHLLMDGWCLPVILREVFTLYEAECKNQSVQLPPSRPFREYIAWLQRQDLSRAEKYWRDMLAGFTTPTPFAVDHPVISREGTGSDYRVERARLSSELTQKLRSLARRHQLTLNTLAQGAWGLLLQRYSGENDVVFGATVSGRPADLPGADEMIGLFINTLPVRLRFSPDTKLLDWLRQLQAQQAELRQYEYSPLVQVQSWSDAPRGKPLFESVVVFENYPVDASMEEYHGTLQISDVRSYARTNYPLTVVFSPGRELGVEIAYEVSRFDPETIQRMLGHLQMLLAGMAEDVQCLVSELPLLTPAERQRILLDWNDVRKPFAADRCFHELFEEQVERTPEAAAVVFHPSGNDSECTFEITYRELNRRANQLAHYLRKLGVGPEVPVGLCIERSIDMIVGILGILKAGGAYVPLDPNYPAERLSFMIQDSGVSILVTREPLLAQLPEQSAQVVCLDADWDRILKEDETNPATEVRPENLAYVIYTSGSTGLPKGAMLQHRGVANLAAFQRSDLHLRQGDRVLQFASLSFDAAVWEFVMALLNGGTLCLASWEQLASGQGLLEVLRQERIRIATLPPSVLSVLPDEDLPDLETVISAGESCPWSIVQRWARNRRFINGYGPTEATVASTLWIADPTQVTTPTVPIGRPFQNVEVYVLDDEMRPVPVGVVGEVYIGGVGLARGYWGRPDLTADRFVPHPFSEESGARLYRTGDLARYLADGNLEFVGRVDQQVKVRGFRIELGEVEAVLGRHPGVQDVVVVAHGEGEARRLVAYVVLESAGEVTVGELRQYVVERLPDYMVPSAFVVLDSFPLTPNGKVDRRALPAPDGSRPELAARYVAPRSVVEEVVAGVWAEVLGVDRVGVLDDFFELGGHSLLATQVVSRLRDALGVEVPLRQLFEEPTVAAVARWVERARAGGEAASAVPPLQPISRQGELPLSFAQQRLWFLDQLSPGGSFYNIPSALRLRGELDVGALERSLTEVVRRHEVLRTTFSEVGGRPVQVIHDAERVELEVVDLTGLAEADREAEALRLAREEARRPFDLERGPLFRARLLRLGREDHVALLTLHHIVSDGWSMGVLVEEMASLYAAFQAGQPSPLAELPIQYADYAAWQRSWLVGEELERQLGYWREQLAGAPSVLELPTDRPRPAVQTFSGSTESRVLSADLSEGLRRLSRKEGVTLFMTLLAAWQALLSRYSGQEDIVVGCPIANRQRSEVERLIGFFVNTLVLRTDLSGEPSFRELLRRVREVSLGAFGHQDLPFEQLVEALQPVRDLSHSPVFQVAFVWQNAPLGELELPGLHLEPFGVSGGTAKYDLTLTMAEGSEGRLLAELEYNTDLFEASTIRRMLAHLERLLSAVVEDPKVAVGKVPLLSAAERRQQLEEWNQTELSFPEEVCAHEWFEERAAARPEAVALIFGEQEVSYGELNERANRLAHYLRDRGVGPEVRVGLCLERSVELLVGLLGILKAGGAFVPLDPAYPEERLRYMVEDSGVRVLLTEVEVLERLASTGVEVVCVDRDWEEICQRSGQNPGVEVLPESLAYVIYTSGSTGRPKGTMLHHRGLVNLAAAQQAAFGVGEGSRVLQFSSLSFDASVWEVVMALLSGGTLCLAPRQVLATGQGLVGVLQEAEVTTVTLPPSVLAVMPEAELPHLETLITAGEALSGDLVRRWLRAGRRFFNAYGPTETTVCASLQLCTGEEGGSPPIGRPIGNMELYVLDRHLEPVPVGVAGELYIGGVGLARGYLGRAELTAERFVPDPFSGRVGARLYRTGDLGRYREDGAIEFLGRADHQVKVRGFRIELGEVESVLREHPGVRDAVVEVGEVAGGDRRLVAYYIAADGQEVSSGELRSYLRGRLPEYMVPSLLLALESFPLTPSGKVDRRALPLPSGERMAEGRAYVAPRDEVEEQVAAICAELLGVERVGVYDNFFDLGGHSLLATQFMSRVRETFEVELPLRSLFEGPTVAEVSKTIQDLKAQGTAPRAAPIKAVAREARRMRRSELVQAADLLSDPEGETRKSA